MDYTVTSVVDTLYQI